MTITSKRSLNKLCKSNDSNQARAKVVSATVSFTNHKYERDKVIYNSSFTQLKQNIFEPRKTLAYTEASASLTIHRKGKTSTLYDSLNKSFVHLLLSYKRSSLVVKKNFEAI